MKKIILSAILFCLYAVDMQAQQCPGINQFTINTTSWRMGKFDPPYDSPDSIGCYAAAMGINTRAKGQASLAIGNATIASGAYTFASGFGSQASGIYAVATGYNSIASGQYASAFGAETQSTGYTCLAIGNRTQATSDNCFAGGSYSIATGLRSFAFGNSSQATGYESIAIGSNSKASGINAFTFGYFSKTTGDYGFALGSYAEARATNNLALGNGSITKAINGMAIGAYNDSTDAPNPLVYGLTDRVFQVGIGASSSARANAITILRNGNMGIGVLNPSEKVDVSGNVKVSGNITVQNKGIIRSNDGVQQKKLVSNVTVNSAFTAGQTKTFTVTWPESFGGAPDAFVGSLVSGAGGWAEVIMTLGATTTTGVTLYVYNPKTISVTPNYTIKIIAIGQQ